MCQEALRPTRFSTKKRTRWGAQAADDDALFGVKLSERGVGLSELNALTSLHAPLGKLSKGARREHRSGGEASPRATSGGVAC